MADIKVEGEVLRKYIKMAQTQALPFGFCPGPSDEDHVLMIDRKRKPNLLGKSARTEGLGSKVACGTFQVTGRDMTLTCERTTSGLAKKMIRFLKLHNVKLNVIVRDLAGDGMTHGAGQPGAADPTQPPADPERAALIARLRAVQPQVQSFQGDTAEKARRMMTLAVTEFKSAKLDRAARSIAEIEAILQAGPQTTPPDTAAAQLSTQLDQARQLVALLDGAPREKLTKAVRIAAKLLATGNTAKAERTLDQIIRAIERQTAAPDPSLDPAARAAPG